MGGVLLVYVAGAVALATALLGIILAARHTLGRGVLAFAIFQVFAISIAVAVLAVQSPSPLRWVMLPGALVLGSLGFLRYYYRDSDG